MYIKRKLEGAISDYLSKQEILAIIGPRQCGKTTLLKQFASHLKKSEFLSFEDINALNLFTNDFEEFVKLYVRGRDYLFIDEFQYAKGGGKKLKLLYDREKIKVIISGSSAIDLTVQEVKFLVGRIMIFNLYPLDFEEYLSFADPTHHQYLLSAKKSGQITDLPSEISKILAGHYIDYAIYGGYPRVVVSESVQEKKDILTNIYNTYFLRDVRDILGLIDDYKLSKLIKALALQTGNLIAYDELSTLSEFPYLSLKKYLNFLEKTYIIGLLRPYFTNKRKEIVKNPKIYFIDNGLRNAVVGDFRSLADRPDGGALLENTVYMELVKAGLKPQFWRDKQKNEVDFIIDFGDGRHQALEVKMTAATLLPSADKFLKDHTGFEFLQLYLNIGKRQSQNASRPVYFR